MGKAAVDGPLRAQVKALEEQVNVSGGQWQRLAVSRSFMRAADEKVRLMCYDEPSSALDPKAEFGESSSFAASSTSSADDLSL